MNISQLNYHKFFDAGPISHLFYNSFGNPLPGPVLRRGRLIARIEACPVQRPASALPCRLAIYCLAVSTATAASRQ